MKRFFRLRVHPAGLVIFAVAFLLLDSHLVLAATAALLLHEGGHLAAMLACGMRGCVIELTPFGGMADIRHFDRYQVWKRMFVSAAGVAVSAGTAFCCLSFAAYHSFFRVFYQANLSLALLNLLPAWPLDGARVISSLFSYLGLEDRIRKLLSYLTILLGAAFVFLGLAGIWMGVFNPGLLVMGPYLCYAAKAEGVSDRVRRLEAFGHPIGADDVVKTDVWTASEGCSAYALVSALAQGSRQRHQIVVTIDPDSGKATGCHTQKQLFDMALASDRD